MIREAATAMINCFVEAMPEAAERMNRMMEGKEGESPLSNSPANGQPPI